MGVCALVLSGCQFVEYDKEKDMAQVVAQIGKVQITKQQVYDIMTPYLEYYKSTYNLDPESEEYKNMEKELKSSALKVLVEFEIIKQTTEGNQKLSATEQKDVDEKYKEALNTFIEQARQNLEAKKQEDSSIDVEASLDKEVDALLKEQGLTRDFLKNNAIDSVYKDKTVKDVTASDEQMQKYYEKVLAEQKESYDKNPSTVNTDFESNKVILYYPVRSVLVTQVLVSISKDDLAAIQAVSNNTKLSDEEKTKQIAALREKALAKIKPTADKVYNLAKSGQDFSTLIDKYNSDPGMENEDIMGRGGYLVNEDAEYAESFKAAALALEKAGDISKPVASDESDTTYAGYHIICAQAVYEAKSEVALDDVRNDFKTKTANDMAKSEYWDAHMEKLKKELNVATFENRL
ncbi:MAG: peptidylprolyl isomerase [Bacillota bacterium]